MGFRFVAACVVAAAGFLGAGSEAFAQANSETELTRETLRAERKLLVSRNLALTEAEGAAFWPVFDAYAADQRKLNDRLIQTIEAFAADYDKMTDERATQLLEDSLAIREDRGKLRRSYLKKFSTALPGKKVARFYQIDSKLDALLDALIAEKIPLVK